MKLRWPRRPQVSLDEDDFREEIRAHLALAREERMADGAGEEEAHYAALREFGNLTRATESTRRVWTPAWFEGVQDLVSDVRYGARSLFTHPAFSLAVIGVLTIGIGLNAAVFTMIKSFALTPVAGVPAAASLQVVHAETDAGRPVRLSYPDYLHLRDRSGAFDSLFGSIIIKANLGRGRGARQVWGELVTGNYFQALGIDALRGRTLLPSDEIAPGKHPVVVISEGLWRRDFASDPSIVGSTIQLNNQPLTVVGVANAAFHGTTVVYDVEVFVPVMMGPDLGFTFLSSERTPAAILSDRTTAMFYPYGYLRPGQSVGSALAQLEAAWAHLPPMTPDESARRLRLVPFLRAPNGAPSYIMPTLVILGAMGLLVLVIACANLAGLVLVRGVSRRGEIAVRLSLGASRVRLLRLLLVENLLLAIPGALFGTLLAMWGVPVLVAYGQRLAAPLRIHFNSGVDGLVIGFAAAAAVGSVLLFGFLPALRTASVNLAATINEDASPRGASRSRFRSALVIAQVAVSLVLLVGAGLASRSVEAARAADPGFTADGATAIGFDLQQNGYDESRGRLFQHRLLEAVREDGAIESATLAAYVPLNMTDTRVDRVRIDGYAPGPGEDLAFMWNVVGPDYFRTMRIPLLAGREFDERDRGRSELVAIINETMARRFFGGTTAALERRLGLGAAGWRTIVGVAADVKYMRIDEAPRPYFYVPLDQVYRSSVTLHTRAAGDPERHLAMARTHVAALDPELPILSARSLTQATRGALIFFDLTALMLFLFGAAGIALAAIGTYGLVAYAVKQSTREIGIRMALGAQGREVVSQFLGRGLRLGIIGAAFGMVAALAVSRLLSRALFGVGTIDVLLFARVLLFVLACVLLATLVPAWRAARTNPLCVLRHH
jgi:macrolide transport system ATP-binding/permease protein